MSEIVKTDAIVLKSMKYGETSKIVTFYSKDFGKVKGIVKGARKTKNKFGSSLETFSYVQIIMYKKENRSLHLVSQCDPLKTFKTITEDLDKLTIGLKIVELIDKISHDEERNPQIFKAILNVLNVLDKQTKNLQNLFYIFEIKLIELLGYKINFNTCGICQRNIFKLNQTTAELAFDYSRGSALCSDCDNLAIYPVRLSVQNCKILEKFEMAQNNYSINNIILGNRNFGEIGKLLFDYLRYHISELKELKSEKIFNKINK